MQAVIEGITAVASAGERLRAAPAPRPSEVVAALRQLPLELLPLLVALSPEDEARQRIQRYLTTWRHIRAELTGNDLKRLGVPQGPDIGRLLWRVLAAKLDGEALTREAEEALICQHAAPTTSPGRTDGA
jgi:tRNA nucleotidyltransferase (CCA-adding enzyme)